MIIIKIAGGLGNQMFQYALGRALLARGREVFLDCSGFDSQAQSDTKRKYELDKFDVKIKQVSPKDKEKFCNWKQYLYYYFGRIIKKDISRIVLEKEHCFLPQIAECDSKYLIGYWQTEKYFKSIRRELLSDFSFQNLTFSHQNEKLRDDILSTKNAVGVHVRGGDYNTADNVSIYGNICDSEYYQKAFEYIEKAVGKAKYYIFTNDPEWAKKMIPFKKDNIEIIDWNSEEDGWMDMYMMSICRHNIIANSSFSWWAAWLNQNSEKIVIAPKKWQNGSDIADIVPDNWIRM